MRFGVKGSKVEESASTVMPVVLGDKGVAIIGAGSVRRL